MEAGLAKKDGLETRSRRLRVERRFPVLAENAAFTEI
jgi:hypothetical protein